jgi:hypothetical protein
MRLYTDYLDEPLDALKVVRVSTQFVRINDGCGEAAVAAT